MIGHRTSAERCRQTGDGGRVSYPSLVLKVNHAHRAGKFAVEVAFFVIECRASETGNRFHAIDNTPLFVFLDEVSVARFLDVHRDAVNRPFPRLLFPFGTAGSAIEYLVESSVAVGNLIEGLPLAAERSFIDGMVGIAFDIDDFAVNLGKN